MASDFITFSSSFVPIISATCDFSALCRTLFPPDLIPTEGSIHLSFHHMRPLISPGMVVFAETQAQTQAGQTISWEHTWGERLGVVGQWEAERAPAMCACSSEKQWYPGLHQKNCVQQVRNGILHLYFTLVTTHLKHWVHLWQHGNIRRMLSCWSRFRGGPWRWSKHLCFRDRLKELGLLSLERTRLWGHLITPSSASGCPARMPQRDFLQKSM